MRVAVIQRRIAHYRLPLYEGIVKNNPDISLTLYCGLPERSLGGSGIPLFIEDPPYVKRVKNYTLNLFGYSFLIQHSVIWHVLRGHYDVLVCEGSLILLSSLIILGLRRLIGSRNIIWSKGWPKSHFDGRLTRWIKWVFLRLAHSYIVYGKEGKKNLLSYGIPEQRITVAQNTIETVCLLNREDNSVQLPVDNPLVQEILDLKQPYIFNIGRHIPEKRIPDLLNAFSIFQSDQSNIEIGLVIAGTGPETIALRKLAEDSDLKSVYFMGVISDRDAEELFFRSSCCVFPGAVGLALNQAMACGKPVICADEPGPDSELLVHESNGLRYQKGNILQFVDCIKRIIEDEELQNTLGAKARQTIKRFATMEKMIDKYVAALRSALKNKN